jgi:hypothetical protein
MKWYIFYFFALAIIAVIFSFIFNMIIDSYFIIVASVFGLLSSFFAIFNYFIKKENNLTFLKVFFASIALKGLILFGFMAWFYIANLPQIYYYFTMTLYLNFIIFSVGITTKYSS